MPTVTTTSIDVNARGGGIAASQRKLVEKLRRQVFAMQRHFSLAEHTAWILEQSLSDDEDSVAVALGNTYEAHTLKILQTQLFRLLIVDLFASVLDKGRTSGSIRNIVYELGVEDGYLPALQAYYADPTALTVTIEGDDLDDVSVNRLKERTIARSVEESVRSMDKQWARIKENSDVLYSVGARRIEWARHQATAHLRRTSSGVVALEDDPPHGEGKLTWDEPIRFLRAIRDYAYDVYALVSATIWVDDHVKISQFYAAAFWDRLKQGKTELKLE